MIALGKHLRRHDEQRGGGSGFRRDCPICRAERLAGALPDDRIISPTARVTFAIGSLLAGSAVPSSIAVADRGGRSDEGVAIQAPPMPAPAARRQGRRGAPRAPPRPALELRHAAHLRGPAATVRRRAARAQPRDAAARLRARMGGLRPGPARQRGGPDRTRAGPAAACDVKLASRPRRPWAHFAVVPGRWACSTGVPRRCGPPLAEVTKAWKTEALHRTRTDDPFLTVERVAGPEFADLQEFAVTSSLRRTAHLRRLAGPCSAGVPWSAATLAVVQARVRSSCRSAPRARAGT